jgi:hypothetical protein
MRPSAQLEGGKPCEFLFAALVAGALLAAATTVPVPAAQSDCAKPDKTVLQSFEPLFRVGDTVVVEDRSIRLWP